MNFKKLSLSISLMIVLTIQGSILCDKFDHYYVASLETITSIACAGAIATNSGFIATKTKVNQKWIVALSRILNDLSSFYNYTQIKCGNDGFCGDFDFKNNLRYAALISIARNLHILYSDLNITKTKNNNSENIDSNPSIKKQKKDEFIDILSTKILPALEGIARIARSAESFRVTLKNCSAIDPYGPVNNFVKKINIDYLCTFVIEGTQILNEVITAKEFNLGKVLALTQAVFVVGAFIADSMGYGSACKKALDALKTLLKSKNKKPDLPDPIASRACNFKVTKTTCYSDRNLLPMGMPSYEQSVDITAKTTFRDIVGTSSGYDTIYCRMRSGQAPVKVNLNDIVIEKMPGIKQYFDDSKKIQHEPVEIEMIKKTAMPMPVPKAGPKPAAEPAVPMPAMPYHFKLDILPPGGGSVSDPHPRILTDKTTFRDLVGKDAETYNISYTPNYGHIPFKHDANPDDIVIDKVPEIKNGDIELTIALEYKFGEDDE